MSYEGGFCEGSFGKGGREKRWVSSLERRDGWTGSGERDVTDSVVSGKGPERGRRGRDPRAEDNDAGEACSQKMAWNAGSNPNN